MPPSASVFNGAMSMESTGTAPPNPHEQQQEPPQLQAPPQALPMEADPSGFTERAPALAALLPDDTLARALAGGDAFAVHAALVARHSREPRGPTRDTVRGLLEQRALFAVSERSPQLGAALGTGIKFVGLPAADKQAEPFIATRVLKLLGMTVWPLSQHLVRRGREGQLEVMGRVPTGLGFRVRRGLSLLATGLVALAGVGAALSPFVFREVFIVNGLSRPVEVRVEGEPFFLEAGHMRTLWKVSLGGAYAVSTRWQGEEKPFEVLSVEASQRAVYNVLGAAALKVMQEDPHLYALDDRALEGTVNSLGEDEHLLRSGAWEDRINALVDKGQVREAVALAVAIAMADPTATRAFEEAARYMMQLEPDEVEVLAWKLQARYPDDSFVNALVQDVLIAVGREEAMRRFYSQPSFRESTFAPHALLYARSHPPGELRLAYNGLLSRFPGSPEVLRAVARIRLADGYPTRALELLNAAKTRALESPEDLELRVRTLMALRQLNEASGAVREYSVNPRSRSWEAVVLAGRLAHIAGPARTQYLIQELASSQLSTPEKKVTYALLTGERNVKDLELKAISDVQTREALELSRTVLTDLEDAVSQVSSVKDGVLRRMPLEPAAVLALELARLGKGEDASRVFRAHFPLVLAREPLEAYVRSGEIKPRFPMVAPDLLAAAYLVRARGSHHEAFAQRAYARWTDGLGGFARRALDADYEELQLREVKPVAGRMPAISQDRADIIRVIPADQRYREQLGMRIPRPWE
jgi:hypothetical protein